MRFEILVEVRLRPGVADPEGSTIERALSALGFKGVEHLRVGKAFRFEVDAPDEASAVALGSEVTDRLLANPVIEESEVTARPTSKSTSKTRHTTRVEPMTGSTSLGKSG